MLSCRRICAWMFVTMCCLRCARTILDCVEEQSSPTMNSSCSAFSTDLVAMPIIRRLWMSVWNVVWLAPKVGGCQEALWCCRASIRGYCRCTVVQKGRSYIVSTCHTCHMGCSDPVETVSRALKAIASRWHGPPCLNLCHRRRRNDP